MQKQVTYSNVAFKTLKISFVNRSKNRQNLQFFSNEMSVRLFWLHRSIPSGVRQQLEDIPSIILVFKDLLLYHAVEVFEKVVAD